MLEKNNKDALESSSCNGGLFQRHDCIPWTQRSIWRIVPGMWRISGPQCIYLNKFLLEPGSLKFLFYYFQQGNMLEKAEVMGKLTALSKKELLKMMADLNIKPEECKLDTTTHGYTLYKLDDIKKHKDGNKDPRKFFKMAFYARRQGWRRGLSTRESPDWIRRKTRKLRGIAPRSADAPARAPLHPPLWG